MIIKHLAIAILTEDYKIILELHRNKFSSNLTRYLSFLSMHTRVNLPHI